jgi:hypothetical protein
MYDYARINETTMREIFEGTADTIEPEEALVVHVFVMGGSIESKSSRLVYQAMRDASDTDRLSIAGDAVGAYCDAKGIAWSSFRVLDIRHIDYCRPGEGHYVIEGLVSKREEAAK